MISQFIHLSGRQLPPPHLQKETTPPPLTSAYLGPESSVLLLRRKGFWGAEVCQGLTWRKAVAPGRGLVKPQVLEDNTSPPCSLGLGGGPTLAPSLWAAVLTHPEQAQLDVLTELSLLQAPGGLGWIAWPKKK